jgi:class 3 adenylate cyclase/pimeloyl-ACP methyl ester carboxylesterase
MALAPTQYVRSGDADIAYQVIGDGPRDVVLAFDWASHLEAVAEQPMFDEFIRSLARFARILWFDMRGIGMSDSSGGVMPVESCVDDVLAVMAVAASSRATLVTQGQATHMAVMAAATHPERITSLVLINGFARFARADDYPAGLPNRLHGLFLDQIERQWGDGTFSALLGPSVASRPGVAEWWGRVERLGATPRLARARMEAILELDVRNTLPLVNVPTLVVHSRENELVRVGHGRYLAEHIPSARLLERESPDHWPIPEPDLLGAIEEFVTGSRSHLRHEERVLATVLFVDVVGSTDHASERGDRGLRATLDRFERVVVDTLALYEGTLVNTLGDGVLATFLGPARGIRCGLRIRDELELRGIRVRSGLHAGEVVRRADDIAGLAVNICARVSALATPGEVLVTRTVRDLVAGSGIAFEDRGEHELKGVPDSWALYAAIG